MRSNVPGLLLRRPVVEWDLTPVRCLAREREGGSFMGQMWVAAAVGGDVVYTWDESKEAIVAERIVPEWFRGILQTDGGSELGCFLRGGKGRTRPPPEITRAGCWAHARRKFFEGAKAGCPLCARLLKIINTLYRLEHIARDAGFTPQESYALRQRRAARIIRGLRRRMNKVIAHERPRSPAAKACLYTTGQWEGLLVYLDHGHVEIDNNSVEPKRSGDRLPQAARRASMVSQNAIRPCALGRKNWLFIGDVGAGQRSATFYSLLGSCLRRSINPRDYLHWLFEHLPHATNQTVHTLTPAAYAERKAAQKPVDSSAATAA